MLADGPTEPDVGYVFPAGGRAGQSVDVRLGICEWTPDLEYFVHAKDVALAVLGPPGPLLLQERPHAIGKRAYNPPPLPREVPARFTIPADCPPGPVRWQIANANGSSRTGVFIVSHDRELVEDEERDGPQPVGSLPVTVSGRVRRNEEIDRYTVRRDSPGPVTCELFARRLGSPFHGVVQVRDSAGALVADAVDTRGRDAACTFFARGGAAYTVSVQDLDFLGNRAFVYRLSVRPGPRLVAAIPHTRHKTQASVEFIGFGILTGRPRLERLHRDVAFGEGHSAPLEYRLQTPFGPCQPIAIDPPGECARGGCTAAQLDAPGSVTEEFDRASRVRRYRFAAKAGERLALWAASRIAGPPVDLALAIAGPEPEGKELARNDDLPGTVDAGLDFTPPKDGVYDAIVSDLSETSDLPHVYRFSIDRPAADFDLEVPQRVGILIGEKAELAVKIERRGGFSAPIRLALHGLPPEIQAPKDPKDLLVPPDKNEWKISLAADKNAPVIASVVQVTGHSRVDGRRLARTAAARTSDNLAPASPEETRIPQVLVSTLLKPRVRIWPVESDERTVNRGTVHLAELGIERLEGFDGDVLLQLESRQPNKFRQGVAGPDVGVPAGQTRLLYPCFVSEELETSDAYRVSVNAMARVRDPRGIEHWLVSNMRSQVSVAMTVEGGLLKLSVDQPSIEVRAGMSEGAKPSTMVPVPVRVLRSPRVAEPVTVRVLVPKTLSSIVSADPIRVPVGQESGTLLLRIGDGPLPAGPQEIVLRAIATQAARLPRLATGLRATPLEPEYLDMLSRGLLPVISEATVSIEFKSSK